MNLQRNWLRAVAIAALMLGLAFPAAAKTIKIGVITMFSGPLSPPGISMNKGLTLYAKRHEKDLPPSVKIKILRRDTTGINPAVARRLAQDLVTRDHVNFIAGVVASPNAFAIAPIATEAKTPFVDMNAGAAAITQKSPYIVRDSFTLWQVAEPMGEWAAKHGFTDAYTAVSNEAPGWDAEGGFKLGFKKAGGKIVGSVRFPVENPDFAPYLQRIKDLKPKTLFVFVLGGPQSTQMMKTYNDLSLKHAGISLVTTQDLLISSQLPNMGDTPLGVISAGTYTESANLPANKSFVAAWHKAYGKKDIPDFASVQGWDGMAMIFHVIEKTQGNFNSQQAMAILSHYKTNDSPRGSFFIDPKTRDIVQNIYIRRCEKVNGRVVNVNIATFKDVKDPWKEMHPAK